jgi:4-diphosphocytidyl-2-C-methyl-D-erythritol kinase
MGLGGGSTDAAATLRGLDRLWGLGFSDAQLCEVGAHVGSDVPACLIGGAVLVTGRGEEVEALPDGLAMPVTLFVPDVEVEDKTRRMYAAIRPDDFSDGHRARVLAESIRRGLPLSSADLINAFDPHVRAMMETAAGAMALCRDAGVAVFACGSGPGFFSPMAFEDLPPLLARELHHDWGVRATTCRTLKRVEALAIREV